MSAKPNLTALFALLEPIVVHQHVELYDLEFLTEYGRTILRLYIDKDGGITIDDCEKISGVVGRALDDHYPIPGSYVLEVSSPGIERKLIKDSHYMANVGKEVEVKLKKPINNQKKFRGVLLGLEDGAVIISGDKGERLRLPRQDLVYCRLILNAL